MNSFNSFNSQQKVLNPALLRISGRTGGSPGTFYGGGGGGTSYISNITVVNADGNNPGAEGYQGIVIIAYNQFGVFLQLVPLQPRP